MKKKRDRLEVIQDILKTISSRNGRIKPTHIMYKANLSHKMLEEYLGDLKQRGLISETSNDGRKAFSLTPKGFEFISKYSMMSEFIGSFGLNGEE